MQRLALVWIQSWRLVIGLAAFLPLVCVGQTPLTVRQELLELSALDQARAEISEIERKFGYDSEEWRAAWERQNSVDAANLRRLEIIVERWGWPKNSDVGFEAATAAFLIIQHANLETQKKFLPLIRDSVSEGEASPSSFAALSDRILMNEGQNQLYGTQLRRNENTGGWYLWPIENQDLVDVRRADLGMVPIAEELARYPFTIEGADFVFEAAEADRRETTQSAIGKDDAPAFGTPEWYFDAVPSIAPSDPSGPEAQLYVQVLPAVGRDDIWSAYPGRTVISRSCEKVEAPQDSLIDYIAHVAESHQIVIINEAHDFPWHRKFSETLLAPLWNEGFRYFAAEAFSDEIANYREEPFGRVVDSFYVSEPTFGALIRSAKQLGYALVPYEAELSEELNIESVEDVMAFREESQATNLVDRILKADPAAKVFIHVGYSHAAEEPIPSFDNRDFAWMAARLKQKTGIDPLTIDQTYCRAADTVPELVASTHQVPAGTLDLAIAYPEISIVQGRGDWRISPGNRLIPVPTDLLPESGRALIEARYATEPSNAIPIDRLLIDAGERIPLVLPLGEFNLTVFHEGSSETSTAIVMVK